MKQAQKDSNKEFQSFFSPNDLLFLGGEIVIDFVLCFFLICLGLLANHTISFAVSFTCPSKSAI